VEDDALQLRVTNPGTLTSEEGGVGLQNARERLELLFGDEAALTLENADANSVVATAVLPPRPGDERPTVRSAPKTAPVLDAE
jgi:hypothetical protein